MLTRRTLAAMVAASFLSTLGVVPALAPKPNGPSDVDRPLTPAELAASNPRMAAAEAYAASAEAQGLAAHRRRPPRMAPRHHDEPGGTE